MRTMREHNSRLQARMPSPEFGDVLLPAERAGPRILSDQRAVSPGCKRKASEREGSAGQAAGILRGRHRGIVGRNRSDEATAAGYDSKVQLDPISLPMMRQLSEPAAPSRR